MKILKMIDFHYDFKTIVNLHYRMIIIFLNLITIIGLQFVMKMENLMSLFINDYCIIFMKKWVGFNQLMVYVVELIHFH